MDRKVYVGDLKIEFDEKQAINEVLESGRISEWKKVRDFEKLFSEYIGRKFCVLVNSGTSALIAGLYALLLDDRFPAIKKGAKVITSPITYIATVNAIVHAGLEPVFVDIDPLDFSIQCDSVEKLLQNATPGEYCMVLPVHLMGYPCDMDRLNALADQYGLVVFEDAAQAHGTLYKEKNLGCCSLLADFSFYIAHNIQAGEMGAVVTDDPMLYRMMKKLKANGRMCDCQICTRMSSVCSHEDPDPEQDRDPRFLHDVIGFNFKTTEFCAALGLAQLKKAEENIRIRQRNVKMLSERLLRYDEDLQLPLFSSDISYLAYPLILKKGSTVKRKALRKFLERNGVECRPMFGCIPTQQPAYGYLKEKYAGNLINAEYVGEHGFYIGCHQYVSLEDIDYIAQVFDAFFGVKNEPLKG
jgi:dTDP-4-amino-4,6-dideoxygalactose transaminase